MENDKEIEEYIGSLPRNVKLIITTKGAQLANNYKRIKLDRLSNEEALQYINTHLMITSQDEEKAKQLAEAVGEIPLHLVNAVQYLKKNQLIRLQDYLEEIKASQSADPVTTLILDEITEKQDMCWQLLQYCAYLDPDYIPISIFEGWLYKSRKELQDIIQPLAAQSLIEVTVDKEGLRIHRIIQDEVKKYANIHQKKSLGVERLFEALVERLDTLLPYKNQSREWKKFEKLAPHIIPFIKECTKLGLENSNIASITNNLGHYYKQIKYNFIESCQYYEQALEIRQRLYKGDHPDTAQSLNDIGKGYEELGDIKQALKYGTQALHMRKRLHPGDNHPAIAESLNNVGMAYQLLNWKLTDKALTNYKQALMIQRKVLKKDHQDIAISLNNIGMACMFLGNNKKALHILTQALKIRQRLYKGDHPDTAQSLNNIGIIYQRLGNKTKACELYKQAYSVFYALLGNQHLNTLAARKNIENLQPNFFTTNYINDLYSFIDTTENSNTVRNECRVMIPKRGVFTEQILNIQLVLQVNVLNKIQQRSAEGCWSFKIPGFDNYGIKGYLDDGYLKRQLGKLRDKEENLVIAKILCFEAMCLGIIKAGKKSYDIAIEFATANPELVKEIATQHPECFIDGSIIKACIKAFPHNKEWKEHLLNNTGIEGSKFQGHNEITELLNTSERISRTDRLRQEAPRWSSWLSSMIDPVSWFGAGASNFKAPGIKSKFVGLGRLNF